MERGSLASDRGKGACAESKERKHHVLNRAAAPHPRAYHKRSTTKRHRTDKRHRRHRTDTNHPFTMSISSHVYQVTTDVSKGL